jgi:PilZ domain
MVNETFPPAESTETSTSQTDRRGEERFPCDLRPFWGAQDANRADSPIASVRDVSTTGIGLRVWQGLKPGLVLVIRLETREKKLSRPLPVRVMHATQQAEGDWLIGCQFVRPLSDQDLRELLGED